MTILDLISEFETLYELGSLSLPGFESDEIKKLLDIEQYKLINQRFQGNNVYRTKFPDTNKRIDDLLGLLNITDKNLTGGFYDNEYVAELPDDYLHIHEIRVKDSDKHYDIADFISSLEIKRFVGGFRNSNPILFSPKYSLITSNTGQRFIRIFYFDSLEKNIETTGGCQISYIKKPSESLTSIADDKDLDYFNDDVWHEIVRAAVDTAISIVTPQKAQISQNQLNKTE